MVCLTKTCNKANHHCDKCLNVILSKKVSVYLTPKIAKYTWSLEQDGVYLIIHAKFLSPYIIKFAEIPFSRVYCKRSRLQQEFDYGELSVNRATCAWD